MQDREFELAIDIIGGWIIRTMNCLLEIVERVDGFATAGLHDAEPAKR